MTRTRLSIAVAGLTLGAFMPALAQEITPVAVSASTNDGNVAANAVDNNLGTRWSGNGDGAWLRLDLGAPQLIGSVKIAWFNGNTRVSRFDLQVSDDGSNWAPLLIGAQSAGNTTAEETFDVADVSRRYIRYLGHGNTSTDKATWSSVTEISVFLGSGDVTPSPTPTVTPTGSPVTPTPTPTATSGPVAGAPKGLFSPPRTQSESSVLLLWDKPDNIYDIPFAAFAVYQDGVKIGETTKLGFTANDLVPNTTYTFEVRTRQTNGTVSAASNAVTVSTRPLPTICNVKSFGAVGNGSTLDTAAIQRAIDQCPAGGVVLIPSGTFLSGALFLKSNMTLEIAAGGTLKGSTNTSHYPKVRCRFEGFELDCYASLLTLGRLDRTGPYNITNVTIRGAGTIDASGRDLGNAEKSASGNRSRGRAIVLMNAQNVQITGLTVSYGPAWTVHAIYSDNITFNNLRLISKNSSYRIANGDGIDPDSSTHINIHDSFFHCGDDAVAIKSGKNNEGFTIAKPTEFVRVTDIVDDGSNGGIVIGSEMSGSVRHVMIRNCSMSGLSWEALDVKSNVVRGGTVEDINVSDVTIAGTRLAIRLTMNYSVNNDGTPAPVPPTFRNMRFTNVKCSRGSKAISVIGLPSSHVRNVTFQNLDITADNNVTVDYSDDILFDNVKLHVGGTPYSISHSTNVVVR
jgi:polygalacturonase